MPDDSAPGQWPQVARIWKQLGSPLRPVEDDLTPVRAVLADWCSKHPGRHPRGLILGVTPELYALPWPDRSLLRAADRTPEMINHVWPGDAAQVLEGDWRTLPLVTDSTDIALCDGGIHLLDFPRGQSVLFEKLADIVAPGGLLILRLFAPAAEQESVDGVLTDLLAGAIPDLNRLKLRLGMALQPSPESGVALRTVWQTLRDTAGDWPSLAGRLGWDLDHLLAIDAYRDSPARYHFCSQASVLTLAAGAFELVSTHVPRYTLGDRCPTLVLRRRVR